jgi:hypothetical protein
MRVTEVLSVDGLSVAARAMPPAMLKHIVHRRARRARCDIMAQGGDPALLNL